MRELSRFERQCEQCSEPLWGTERQRFCSKACQQRAWRAEHSSPFRTGGDLLTLCRVVLERAELGSSFQPSKLLPRLFRATARELRMRGWDPIELLMSHPDDPASDPDSAPGGIEGTAPQRRKWLYPPELELRKLEAIIAQRQAQGHSVAWHLERQEQIREYLVLRDATAAVPTPAKA